MLTEDEVMARLLTAIDAAGGQRKFAALYKLTPGYVHDVVHGRRALADRILAIVGVERKVEQTVTYQDKNNQ